MRRNEQIAAIELQLLNQLTLRQVTDIKTFQRRLQDTSINAASIYLWKVSLPKDDRPRAGSVFLKWFCCYDAQHIRKRSGCRCTANGFKKSSSGKFFCHPTRAAARSVQSTKKTCSALIQ